MLHMQEMLEQEIVDNMDIIGPVRSVKPGLPTPSLEALHKSEGKNRMVEIGKMLESMGFNLANLSPFGVLGFSELDGPGIEETRIKSRRDWAFKTIQHWALEEDKPGVDKMYSTIEVACPKCIVALPDILKKRKALKGINKEIAHWQELSVDGLAIITAVRPVGCATPPLIATQLSNIFKQQHDNQHIMHMHDTRTLLSKLNSQPNTIAEALATLD